jgi:threonine dehydrogenase-like Zn-dependent dehydrogenase
MPTMQKGDILGHETMGEVVEVGSAAKSALKVGDRVVIPFTIFCGECDQCKRGFYSCASAPTGTRPCRKGLRHQTAGLFGYSHLTGGYAGGQADVPARSVRGQDAHQGAERHLG